MKTFGITLWNYTGEVSMPGWTVAVLVGGPATPTGGIAAEFSVVVYPAVSVQILPGTQHAPVSTAH